MSNISENDRIEDVAPGDIVGDQGGAVVDVLVHHLAGDGFGAAVDDGATFQVEYAAGTRVTRSLESKWESPQSPTQQKPG